MPDLPRVPRRSSLAPRSMPAAPFRALLIAGCVDLVAEFSTAVFRPAPSAGRPRFSAIRIELRTTFAVRGAFDRASRCRPGALRPDVCARASLPASGSPGPESGEPGNGDDPPGLFPAVPARADRAAGVFSASGSVVRENESGELPPAPFASAVSAERPKDSVITGHWLPAAPGACSGGYKYSRGHVVTLRTRSVPLKK